MVVPNSAAHVVQKKLDEHGGCPNLERLDWVKLQKLQQLFR